VSCENVESKGARRRCCCFFFCCCWLFDQLPVVRGQHLELVLCTKKKGEEGGAISNSSLALTSAGVRTRGLCCATCLTGGWSRLSTIAACEDDGSAGISSTSVSLSELHGAASSVTEIRGGGVEAGGKGGGVASAIVSEWMSGEWWGPSTAAHS
jgi:hypothetical protein